MRVPYLPDDSPAFLSLDGEEVQIRNVMNIRESFIEANITVAKRAASLSKYGNALDAGNIHKAAKTVQRHMPDSRALYGKDLVVNFIYDQIKLLRGAFLSNDRIDIMARASVRVVSSLQATLTQELILHSFEKAAQSFPLSLDRKLSLYCGDISQKDLEKMRTAFNECVAIMRATGRLTEEQMDTLGVPDSWTSDSRHLPKDERVLHHQRSAILTEELVATKYALYQEMKAARSSSRKAKLTHAEKIERNKKRKQNSKENMPPAKRRGRPRKSNSAVSGDTVIL